MRIRIWSMSLLVRSPTQGPLSVRFEKITLWWYLFDMRHIQLFCCACPWLSWFLSFQILLSRNIINVISYRSICNNFEQYFMIEVLPMDMTIMILTFAHSTVMKLLVKLNSRKKNLFVLNVFIQQITSNPFANTNCLHS